MQASKMKFLRKIKGVAMFDKLRKSAIRESLDIESLLRRIERSQIAWPCTQNASEMLPKQTLFAKVNGKRLVRRPQTRWLDYVEDLSWNRLGLHSSKMQFVLLNRNLAT